MMTEREPLQEGQDPDQAEVASSDRRLGQPSQAEGEREESEES